MNGEEKGLRQESLTNRANIDPIGIPQVQIEEEDRDEVER